MTTEQERLLDEIVEVLSDADDSRHIEQIVKEALGKVGEDDLFERLIEEAIPAEEGCFNYYDSTYEAALMIDRKKTGEALKTFISYYFNGDAFVDENGDVGLGDALSEYKKICGQEALDEIYSNALEDVGEDYIFEGIIDWDESLCSANVLIHKALQMDYSTEKLLDIVHQIQANNHIEDANISGYDELAIYAKKKYESEGDLNGVFMLFELALKKKSEVAYKELMELCDEATENGYLDADKVLDILKKTAELMPEKASEIADKIIEADDSEETISKDDLEWYETAYELDNGKKEKIQQIIFSKAESEKVANKYCKKIFGAGYVPVISSNGEAKTARRKSGTGKKRRKKSKGLMGKIKSWTKPIYKLFK